MTRIFALALKAATLTICLSSTAAAQTTEAAQAAKSAPEAFEIRDGYDVSLDDYTWTHRPVIIFADSPADPRFHDQIAKLQDDIPALIERDVLVFVDTAPTRNSPLRQSLRPRGFMLVLIGKDGGVKLRKPLPWSVRELSRTIDKMPIRQREIVEDRDARQLLRQGN